MIVVKYLLKVTKSAHIQKLNQLTFSCADLTACGRNINNAKTNEGPVSVQAEAGFFWRNMMNKPTKKRRSFVRFAKAGDPIYKEGWTITTRGRQI